MRSKKYYNFRWKIWWYLKGKDKGKGKYVLKVKTVNIWDLNGYSVWDVKGNNIWVVKGINIP